MISAVDGSHHLGELAPPVPHDVELIGEIGRGSQSVVYRIRRDGADYALKTSLQRVPGRADARAMQRESALLAWISHPNLPEAYESGIVDGRPYLIMDLVEGCDVATLIRRAALPFAQVTDIGRQVAAALGALHTAGLVHRDVKPTNIVLQPDGRVRLLDLGLAVRGAYADSEAERAAVGTLTYAAPEQSGMLKRPVDLRCDLYALGGVIYECLTGHPPYEAEDIGELLWQHASATVPDPRQDRPEVPAQLAAITVKLLAKDPDDRYQSAEGVAFDLERCTREPAGSWQLGCEDAPVDVNSSRPVVGRDAESAALLAAWERTREGRGGIAVIHGPTGIGKTRLAQEIARRVRGLGAPVLTSRCGADGPPLGALRAAVEAYVRSTRRLAPYSAGR